MRIESKLCHITENKAVVQVNGWLNDQNLGSALAEGPTVEIAEDKAISRLNTRLNVDPSIEESTKSSEREIIKKTMKVELPKSDKIENINVKFNSDDMTISFNSRYLIDIASQIENDSIIINLKDPGSPVLIKDLSDEDSFHVVMPMKI